MEVELIIIPREVKSKQHPVGPANYVMLTCMVQSKGEANEVGKNFFYIYIYIYILDKLDNSIGDIIEMYLLKTT